jgi:large subunit ribosomal protein L2
MGKKIRVQRRGRGTATFRAATHKRVAPARYELPAGKEKGLKGIVKELLHEPGRGAPLAKIQLENGEDIYSVASEGMSVGQEVQIGASAACSLGSILPIGQLAPGTLVCNLELNPGDGGKIARASGTYATIIAHGDKGTTVALPSGKSIVLSNECLATVGVVAGGGRAEKPFATAGKKLKWMMAKGRVYPITKGIAMNAAFHPHGGGAHISSSLRPTTVSKNAPPGQKVGLIAARQAGRRKRGMS